MKPLASIANTRFHRFTTEKNACHHHNSRSFNWMFLKLADKEDMDKISTNWSDRLINFSYVPLIAEKAADFIIGVTRSF